MLRSIHDIQDFGKLILLDDGSKLEISSFDAFHTQMWMLMDQVEESLGKLTNVSRGNQSVDARRKY